MKKSLLLGVVAVALLGLPALAGEQKYEGWVTHTVVTYDPQYVDDFPVKMVIPWYIKIVNQKDWEITLDQVDCANLGRGSGDWPCFKGCKDLVIATNFDCTLLCGVNKTYLAGNWGCSVSPQDVDKPGGTTTVCVKLWKADLLGAQPGQNMHVADIDIYVKPR